MAKIKLRRDIESNWTLVDPILADGEPGIESDTGKIKYGDGITSWSGLSYKPAYFTVVESELPEGNGSIVYNNQTAILTYTPPAHIGLGELSVTAEATPAGNGGISYNTGSGEFTYTPPTALGIGAVALNAFSVGPNDTASGEGGISYIANDTSGVFTYTPPEIPVIGNYVFVGDLITLDGKTDTSILLTPNDGNVWLQLPTDDVADTNPIILANQDVGGINIKSGTNDWLFNGDGSLTFPDAEVQTTAYSGGQGHMFMIDTNRTDTYTEVGNADKPFKTFAAAIAAADALDTTVTFVLMGCTITENVDFSNTSFTSITIATTCRSVISGNITIADVPAMSQMVFRNIEVGGTFTILGDETSEQFNSVSFYNTSFSGPVSITATNATAFYEVAFFDTVDFINLSYLYINGAQFNDDWTITADDTGTYPIPSRGINPGTGGSVSIVFGTIANNVYFVKDGTASYVFQPHMTRLGRTTESYTIPAGWIVSAYGADFRGTWTNNGSMGMKLSGTDNRVLGTAPSYSSIIGGDRVIADLAPASSAGVAGDRAGMIAVDNTYLYVCTADYSDGLSDIWTRTTLTTGTW